MLTKGAFCMCESMRMRSELKDVRCATSRSPQRYRLFVVSVLRRAASRSHPDRSRRTYRNSFFCFLLYRCLKSKLLYLKAFHYCNLIRVSVNDLVPKDIRNLFLLCAFGQKLNAFISKTNCVLYCFVVL